VLKAFLAKYTDRHIPDDSTLRKNYIPGCYKKIMTSIQNKVADNYIWVSADETTDILGRCVTNVVIGVLHPTISYTPYLIRTAITSSINSSKMCEIIEQSLSNSCITVNKENV
jgi:arginine/ornithine N-succinyltransferase beta subunit